MSIWTTLTETLVGFAGHLIGGLKLAASFIFARVLAWAGLSFASINYVLPEVKSFIGEYLTALPSQVRDMAGAMGIDVFMVLILSAIVAKVGYRAFLVGVDSLQNMINNAGG